MIQLSKQISSNYQIIIVGLTEKQKSSLPSNIIGYTRTNNVEELRSLYAIADAFVNPTYEDNFPTTNIEALACGTPVITYDTGGSPEAINEKCGFVVEKGNTSILKKIIEFEIKNIFENQCINKSFLYNKLWTVNEYMFIFKNI